MIDIAEMVLMPDAYFFTPFRRQRTRRRSHVAPRVMRTRSKDTQRKRAAARRDGVTRAMRSSAAQKMFEQWHATPLIGAATMPASAAQPAVRAVAATMMPHFVAAATTPFLMLMPPMSIFFTLFHACFRWLIFAALRLRRPSIFDSHATPPLYSRRFASFRLTPHARCRAAPCRCFIVVFAAAAPMPPRR
jgi:hypothetical protein